MSGLVYWPPPVAGADLSSRDDLRSMMHAAAAAAAPVDLRVVDQLDERTLSGSEVLVISDAHVDARVVSLVAACDVPWVQLSSSGSERSQELGLDRHVTLTNAAPVWAPAVADHAVALLLALSRQIPSVLRQQAHHVWSATALEGGLCDVNGSTVVVLGCGCIGGAVASRLSAFEARVVGITRDGRPRPTGPFDEFAGIDELAAILEDADALVVCLPLTPSTRHVVGPAELDALGPRGLLVNVARGGLVDQSALEERLRDTRLGGAALDVTDPEPLPPDHRLWEVESLIVTPHLATLPAGSASAHRLGALVAANARRRQQGLPLLHRVATS